MLNPHTFKYKIVNFFRVFFLKLFALKIYPRLRSQFISVGQKSSVTNSGVKRVIFETFTFYFAQTYSSILYNV